MKTSILTIVFVLLTTTTWAKEPVRYLYLVQHAERVDKAVDPNKPITTQGRKDIKKTAHFLKKQKPEIKTIFHSQQLRAKQTAEVLGKTLKIDLKTVSYLEWDSPVTEAKAKIDATKNHMMIVGHMPHLGKLASALLTGKSSSDVIEFQKAGIVCLQQDAKGQWSVTWVVTPGLEGI